MPTPTYPELEASAVKAALRASSDRPHYFALIPKGSTEGVLMLSRTRISPKFVTAARQAFDNIQAITGVCYGGEGKEGEDNHVLVFEQPKNPSATWEKITKTLIKAQTGLNSKVQYIQGRDDVEVDPPHLPAALVKQSAHSDESIYRMHLAQVIGQVNSAQAAKVAISPELTDKIKTAAELASRKDFTGAVRLIGEAKSDVEAADRDALKKSFDVFIDHFGKLTYADEFSRAWFKTPIQPIRKEVKTLENDIHAKKIPVSTLRAKLENIRISSIPEVEELHRKRKAYADYCLNVSPQIEKALQLSSMDNPMMLKAQDALRQAVADRSTDEVLASASSIQVEQLLTSIKVELDQVLKLSTDRIPALMKAEGAKPKEVRAKVLDLLSEDPEILKRLANSPEGRHILDKLVADIGKTAKGKADNAFVAAALQARYGAQFKGDLANSAGPRLYKVFGMVPDTHTRLNPMIAEVKRNKNFKTMSWYGTEKDADEGVGEHHIIINLMRTGGVLGWGLDLGVGSPLNPINKGVTSYRHVKGDKKINAFDAVTLHEIGHGVDAQLKFMEKKGSAKAYGGWLEHDIEEVADVIGAETGFYADFSDQPRAMLRGYLLHALSKGFDPARVEKQAQSAASISAEALLQDPGVQTAVGLRNAWETTHQKKAALKTHVITASKAIALGSADKPLAQAAIVKILMNGEDAKGVVKELRSLAPNYSDGKAVDWSALAKHKAVEICKAIKLKGSNSGLWELGTGAAKYAVGGRVYQEAYAGDWNSYDADALNERVTNYQFRAAGEWFADAYSAYYLGKLPDSHPLTAVLDKASNKPAAQ